MNDFEKLRLFIKDFQNKKDKNFKLLPNDEHSKITFNHGNEIIEFVFSTKSIREECMYNIPKELLSSYNYFVEQESGMTYYIITKEN